MRCVGKIIFLSVFLNVLAVSGWSQACTTLGQNPFSAFPVCGSNVFTQQTVPQCGDKTIPTHCPSGGPPYQDLNPFWYKFTCYTSGTLAILITPNNIADDYDWELFDITGHDPSDVYTDPSLIVSYNWSGETGVTGTSPNALHASECGSTQGGPIIPLFSQMPVITVGHQYLLMISHFTSTNQSGYTLSFPTDASQNATAVITDPSVPAIDNAYGVCDGSEIVVKLSKKIKCSSLAADGSDFSVSGTVPVQIISASGNACTTGFDMDSVRLKLKGILSPGTYTITSKIGTDGNSLIDNCDNNMATGLQYTLRFFGTNPTPMDSITPPVCITDTLQLVFSRPMMCSSIAADGSDFTIAGPVPVTVKSASGVCTNGLSTTVRVFLTKPIRVNGNFSITLKNGSDGNSLLDECGFVTPAGSTLPFTTKNITTADFQSSISPGCKYDTIYLTHNGYGGTTQWQWSVDGSVASLVQNPILVSKSFGAHDLQLAVNNGFCSDTARTNFTFVDQTIKASFSAMDTLCPTDTLHFTDMSTANSISWTWNFGNGVTSNLQFPPAQNYPLTGRRSNYVARLAVSNSYQCSDTAYKIITVLASCYIAVPSAFTPNGDGLNDYLYPLNAFKAVNLEFRIYNRWGQVVFETKDWTKKWDGRINSQPQPSGTFVWTLDYTDRDTGQKVSLKGTSVLIR